MKSEVHCINEIHAESCYKTDTLVLRWNFFYNTYAVQKCISTCNNIMKIFFMEK